MITLFYRRRLIWETSQLSKRGKGGKGRLHWTSYKNENDDDYDDDDYEDLYEFETGLNEFNSSFDHKPNKNGHKRKNTVNTLPSMSCCPQRYETIQPHSGRNSTGICLIKCLLTYD